MDYFILNEFLGSADSISLGNCEPVLLSAQIDKCNYSFIYVDGINVCYKQSNDILYNYAADSFAYNGDAIPQLYM
ncbi:MAG: hypothetical protein IPG60_02425 [Bacteroidetes bacterium]|nr:hypothetical protein [Bacteroidota bacterium]MBP7399691.1 hypothetical protein [Chitinophagales bacterium]MBK7108349.1 hypothetical protein [Bacteroidota bacterium]MBK8486226.1 hypothetical protein [Bacteroidota bacterium]MBK8681177.1 hypothetical protein [Bacteroidota bacterium]